MSADNSETNKEIFAGNKEVTGFSYSTVQLNRTGELQFDTPLTGMEISLVHEWEKGGYKGLFVDRYDRNPNQTTNRLGSLILRVNGDIEKIDSFDPSPEQVQKTLSTVDVATLYTDSNLAPSREERQKKAGEKLLIYQLVMGQCLGARKEE